MDSGFRRNDGCCELSGRVSQGRFVKRPFPWQGPFAGVPCRLPPRLNRATNVQTNSPMHTMARMNP